jgi:chemotaxis protein methyltransferase CheR
MILAKYIPLNKVEIIASDIDDAVLAFAKNGVYSEKSLVDLPKDLLSKNFTKVDATHYAISEDIKKHITFKKNNLLKDNYDKNLNMIVCRNVVIYFTDEAKDGVYRRFNNSLVKEGLLFIGSTEQIIRSKELGFESMETFFYKKV